MPYYKHKRMPASDLIRGDIIRWRNREWTVDHKDVKTKYVYVHVLESVEPFRLPRELDGDAWRKTLNPQEKIEERKERVCDSFLQSVYRTGEVWLEKRTEFTTQTTLKNNADPWRTERFFEAFAEHELLLRAENILKAVAKKKSDKFDPEIVDVPGFDWLDEDDGGLTYDDVFEVLQRWVRWFDEELRSYVASTPRVDIHGVEANLRARVITQQQRHWGMYLDHLDELKLEAASWEMGPNDYKVEESA
jgi:hypothetical protein